MQTLALPAARAVVPRPVATTLVLRDSRRGPDVLMVKRSPNASFMPDPYVVPGSAVDAADAAAPCGETAEALAERIGDGGETTTLEWVAPVEALRSRAAGRVPMDFATVSTLSSLLPFAARDLQATLDHAVPQRELPRLHPCLKIDTAGRIVGVMLPGQPGCADLEGDDASDLNGKDPDRSALFAWGVLG